MWKWIIGIAACAYYFIVLGSLLTSVNLTNTSEVLGESTVSFATSQNTPDPNDILLQVNAARQQRGIATLQPDKELGLIAQKRANSMHMHSYYSHEAPDGSYYYDLLREASYSTLSSCENLNLSDEFSSQRHVNDWLNSKAGHRECALDDSLTRAGYAAVPLDPQADKPSYIIVAIHAAPRVN